MSIDATPAKLKSGDWGVRLADPDGHVDVKPGDIVTVTTRNGRTWDKKIAEVVFEGEFKDDDGNPEYVTLCSTVGVKEAIPPPTPKKQEVEDDGKFDIPLDGDDDPPF